MVPAWMTFSDLFKVTIIQRQIAWKWYNTQLYLLWPTNRKSYIVYQRAPFSMTLNDPYCQFQDHAILWRWVSQKPYYIQWNTNRDLDTPHSTVSFRMTLSILEWLSKISNDTKRRAVSLRQLSFLFWYQTLWQYSDVPPPNGDVEWRWVWKNYDFRPSYCFISEMIQGRAIVTMKRQ